MKKEEDKEEEEEEEDFDDAVSELSFQDIDDEEEDQEERGKAAVKKSVKNEDEDDHRRGRGKNFDESSNVSNIEEEDKEEEKTRRRGGGGNKASTSNANTTTTTTNNTFSEQFPFHKACFENDRETVKDFLVTAERLKTSSSSEGKNRNRRREEEEEQEEKYDFDLLNSFDSRGNTALHLAIMRKNTDIVRILTEHPLVDVNVRNCVHGWKPLDEAIHVKDRQAAIYILTAKKRKAKESLDTNTPKLMQRLMDAPDFTAKLKWELNSPIFGPILRRVAPSDTYTLTKIGTRVRIDGELRGIEDVEGQSLEEKTTVEGTARDNNNDKNNNKYGGDFITLSDVGTNEKKSKKNGKKRRGGLLPVWHRAPFSIVFLANPKEEEDAKTSGGNINTAMLYFDHENKKCIDALEENSSKKSSNIPPPPQSDLLKDIAAMTPEELLENEADLLFVENPSRGVYEPQEYTFSPVDSWGSYLGVSERTKESKIDGRYARVMEAKGKAMETRKYRSGFLPADETYDFESYASDAKEFQDRPIYRDVTRIRSVGKKQRNEDEYFEFDDKRRSKNKRKEKKKRNSGINGSSINDGGGGETLEDVDDGTMGRKMSCRVWLVENFPLKVQDLLPVVEVASQANKNMKRFRNLLTNWGSEPSRQNYFPVKCSIPIAYTVHFDVLLHNFKLLAKDESDRLQFQDKIFNTPDGYDLKGLDEAVKELEDKLDKLEATAMAEEERERALMEEEEDNVYRLNVCIQSFCTRMS